jgi:hypothetical protein
VDETPLEKATRHAMIGAHIVARHKLLIARLRAHGHDTTSAEALLATLIATQRIFEEHMRAALKESGLDKRGTASIMPVSFQPSHDTYEPRSAKMERVARAMSAGWMIRAAQVQSLPAALLSFPQGTLGPLSGPGRERGTLSVLV